MTLELLSSRLLNLIWRLLGPVQTQMEYISMVVKTKMYLQKLKVWTQNPMLLVWTRLIHWWVLPCTVYRQLGHQIQCTKSIKFKVKLCNGLWRLLSGLSYTAFEFNATGILSASKYSSNQILPVNLHSIMSHSNLFLVIVTQFNAYF